MRRPVAKLACAAVAAIAFGAVAAVAALATPIATLGPPRLPYGIRPMSDVPPPMAPRVERADRGCSERWTSDLNRQGGANSALVVDETADRTLWAYNDTVARLPASVEKLWTTTTALLELGPSATFQTKVSGSGRLEGNGTFVGTIYLRGGGDPTFGSGTFDHIMYHAGATVQSLAASLRRAGVRRIQGRIVGDESYFDSLRGGPDTGYQPNLETEGSLSALSFDAGFTDLHEDQLDANPPLVATQAFASALRAAGVSVPADTPITTGLTPRSATPLASENSPSLAKLMFLTNSPSDNFFAEMLLKGVGARFGGGGTTARGASVVRSLIGQSLQSAPAARRRLRAVPLRPHATSARSCCCCARCRASRPSGTRSRSPESAAR